MYLFSNSKMSQLCCLWFLREVLFNLFSLSSVTIMFPALIIFDETGKAGIIHWRCFYGSEPSDVLYPPWYLWIGVIVMGSALWKKVLLTINERFPKAFELIRQKIIVFFLDWSCYLFNEKATVGSTVCRDHKQ